jgi:hypothetical protein
MMAEINGYMGSTQGVKAMPIPTSKDGRRERGRRGVGRVGYGVKGDDFGLRRITKTGFGAALIIDPQRRAGRCLE